MTVAATDILPHSIPTPLGFPSQCPGHLLMFELEHGQIFWATLYRVIAAACSRLPSTVSLSKVTFSGVSVPTPGIGSDLFLLGGSTAIFYLRNSLVFNSSPERLQFRHRSAPGMPRRSLFVGVGHTQQSFLSKWSAPQLHPYR